MPAADLPLINRYQAAWVEHATRVAQRQNVVQIYLTAIGVFYGFWFTKPGDMTSLYLVIGISFLSLCSSVLMAMHNRVMQKLSEFMKDCEHAAADMISGQCTDSGTKELFYFSNRGTTEVQTFHLRQRLFQRLVLALIFTIANLGAITLAASWKPRPPAFVYWVSGCMSVLSISALFNDYYWRWREERRRSRQPNSNALVAGNKKRRFSSDLDLAQTCPGCGMDLMASGRNEIE